jgi:Protein of unknown function with HXXEE motif
MSRDRLSQKLRTALWHSGLMRWHYRDAGLLWPFAPAFAIHVAEEWFAGFTTWVAQIAGRPMPDRAFLAINAIAMLLLLIGIRAASRSESKGWIAVAIAAIVLINTVSHMAGAVLTQSYAPGLISAVVLYVPLGSLTLIRAIDQSARGTVSKGVAAATAIHGLVFVVAFLTTR